MAKKLADRWIVSIKVKGPRPDVRCLCGDTFFMTMKEGQIASWTVKKVSSRSRLLNPA